MTKFYQLESEDATSWGGPMHLQNSTKTNFTKFFRKLANAKKFAEKDYGKKINWQRYDKNTISSGDLSYVCYTIVAIKLEDE